MTTTTDLLRLAAQFVFANPNQYNIEKLEACAASLLALADQMERAEPVAYQAPDNRERVHVTPLRKKWLPEHYDKEWLRFREEHKYDIPLFAHPAPEVQRDAERWKRDVEPQDLSQDPPLPF